MFTLKYLSINLLLNLNNKTRSVNGIEKELLHCNLFGLYILRLKAFAILNLFFSFKRNVTDLNDRQ